MSDGASPKSKRRLFVAVAIVSSVLLSLTGAEILTRLFREEKPNSVPDEKTLSYRYDAELGWFPIANSMGRFTGSRPFSFQHNEDGFRDRRHGPKVKPRIAFLGDSYVWGYDAEAEERFTDKLQRLLPDWEILNLGVSGYATDQELLLLERWFGVYQPDVLVLVFSDNDTLENTLNVVNGGYYKPYFEMESQGLVLKGVPAPKCLHYYRAQHPWLLKSQFIEMLVAEYLKRAAPSRALNANPTLALILQIKAFAESKGAKFVLAYGDEFHGARKRAFAEKSKSDYLFLVDSNHLRTEYFYPSFGNHFTPRGHDLACSRLFQFFTTNSVLELKTDSSPK